MAADLRQADKTWANAGLAFTNPIIILIIIIDNDNGVQAYTEFTEAVLIKYKQNYPLSLKQVHFHGFCVGTCDDSTSIGPNQE